MEIQARQRPSRMTMRREGFIGTRDFGGQLKGLSKHRRQRIHGQNLARALTLEGLSAENCIERARHIVNAQ